MISLQQPFEVFAQLRQTEKLSKSGLDLLAAKRFVWRGCSRAGRPRAPSQALGNDSQGSSIAGLCFLEDRGNELLAVSRALHSFPELVIKRLGPSPPLWDTPRIRRFAFFEPHELFFSLSQAHTSGQENLR